MDVSKDKSVMGVSMEPRKHKSLLRPNSQSSSSSKTSILTTIGKTLMDSAVNDYYAQTVSSQFMSHETDVLDMSFPWKDRGSESLLSPYIKKSKLILKSDMCCSISTENLFSSNYSQTREQKCNEGNISSNSIRTILSSQKRSLSPDFSDSPQLVVTTNNTQTDLFAVFSQEESDSSIKLISKKPKLDNNEFLNNCQGKGNICLSDDNKILEIEIYDDDSISSPTFPNDIFEKNISNSTIEETFSQPVKSLAEKIEQIKAQHAQMREAKALKEKSKLCEENTVIPHVPFMEGMSSQKLSTSFTSLELENIESSPNHKVDQWLNDHLNKEAHASSSPTNYIELKIEDFDSPEKRNTCMKNRTEIPDINKENLDPSNTVKPKFLDTEISCSLDLDESVEFIEEVHSEEAKHENTFRIIEVNTEKPDAIYLTKTDDAFECTQKHKFIEEVKSEEVECENNYRIIEDVNTEKCDETIVENQNTYRQIEDFNTEKHERTHCSKTSDPFEIECSESPEIRQEVKSAAQILMSLSQSKENNNDTSIKKKIKFKPCSLGARLHLELNKQKSAAEIWNYEVTKAHESQDSNTLAELFQERLDLTMVCCWSEYSHIIVKAVKTKYISDEQDNNTVLLLLKTSDFPKRFQQMEGQNFSIFPPWNSQWVPELGQSFLTNIQRIKFSSTSKSSIQEIRTERSLPLDLMDEDFYIKLIGLEGGLMKTND